MSDRRVLLRLKGLRSDLDDIISDLGKGPKTGETPPPPGEPTGADLVREARRHLGKPYLWATAGPNTFDCSGLVYYCVARVMNKAIDPSYRDSHKQFQWGEAVNPHDAQPGDLLFYDTAGGGEVRLGNRASHVGIYDPNGKYGANTMVNALNPGAGVVESDISGSYWTGKYLGTRRVLPA